MVKTGQIFRKNIFFFVLFSVVAVCFTVTFTFAVKMKHLLNPALRMMVAQTLSGAWQVSTGLEQIIGPAQLHLNPSPERRNKLFTVLIKQIHLKLGKNRLKV